MESVFTIISELNYSCFKYLNIVNNKYFWDKFGLLSSGFPGYLD